MRDDDDRRKEPSYDVEGFGVDHRSCAAKNRASKRRETPELCSRATEILLLLPYLSVVDTIIVGDGLEKNAR